MTDRLDGATVNAAIEIEQYGRFDYETRRFIAHALSLVPSVSEFVGNPPTHGDNSPASFNVSDAERDERTTAYAAVPTLRSEEARGAASRSFRRNHFADLLSMAQIDLRWKRLTTPAAFIFCYERLVGHPWRELLPLCWKEAALHRRKRLAAQLPLDGRLRDDEAVPTLLDNDLPPIFYPTLADADAFGAPLLSRL